VGGGGKGGNLTSAGWQVTLCETVHVSSRSGEACLRTAIYAFTCIWSHSPDGNNNSGNVSPFC